MSDNSLGAALDLALLLGFLTYLFWAYRQRKRKPAEAIFDGPADEPYRVYTRKYDLTLPAREVPAALAADPMNRAKGWFLRDPSVWHRKIEAARAIALKIPDEYGEPLQSAFAGLRSDEWAICILVDHSGSMRDEPILETAGTLLWALSQLADLGAGVTLLGFSTVTWHGGGARNDWLRNGQPKRPGRLCPLLHIIYKSVDKPLAEEDWAVMVHPDILRENVDGEAIEWACDLLREGPEPNKILVVLSDGASVDDATLLVNGPSYLERHLISVVRKIEASGDIALAALGIGHEVNRYYRRSHSIENLADLPQTLSSLIAQTVSEVQISR